MARQLQRLITHPALALGSTLLWGAIECLALWRSARRSSALKRG